MVDSACSSAVRLFSFFAQELVPESCCRIIGFSEEYREPFVCNFLGLSVGVELPAHVIASDQHVLLDILPPLRRDHTHYSREELQTKQGMMADGEGKGAGPCRDPLQNYKLMVYTSQPRSPEQKSESVEQV